MTNDTEIRQLDLKSIHEAEGAQSASVFGWEIPVHYGDPEKEYNATVESCALIDLSFMSLVETSGSDVEDYLNRRLSQRIVDFDKGQKARATQLSGEGRMEADLELLSIGSQKMLLLSPPSISALDLATLCDKYVFTEDATFQPATEHYCIFGLVGPESKNLAEAAGIQVPSKANEVVFSGSDDSPIFVFKSEFLGGALAIIADRKQGEKLFQTLIRSCKELNGALLGYLAFDTYRVENGIAWWGVDLSEKSIPLEADLMSAIHTNKGCYPGQEVIAKIMNLGHPARKLAGVIWSSDDPPVAGKKVFSEDKEAGVLTSSTYSPRYGKAIGLVMMKWNYRGEGTKVVLEDGPAGEIVALPFRS